VKVDGKFPQSFINACQHLYNAERACKAWTLANEKKVCWLKSAAPAMAPHPYATSGMKLDQDRRSASLNGT
jgi:hypothetical protein